MNAITEIKKRLWTPLQNLQKLSKNSAPEKPLMADLWGHFGKVLVFGVDEGKTGHAGCAARCLPMTSQL